MPSVTCCLRLFCLWSYSVFGYFLSGFSTFSKRTTCTCMSAPWHKLSTVLVLYRTLVHLTIMLIYRKRHEVNSFTWCTFTIITNNLAISQMTFTHASIKRHCQWKYSQFIVKSLVPSVLLISLCIYMGIYFWGSERQIPRVEMYWPGSTYSIFVKICKLYTAT